MKKLVSIAFVFLISLAVTAQPKKYTVSNAHSHNDYEQSTPFWIAYNAGFGSIEADIFLVGDSLYVAHDTVELKKHRSLEQYYLQPLARVIDKNGGSPYSDNTKPLELLIDIKTDSINTLNKLVEVLKGFPTLTDNSRLKFVITGNRPDESLFTSYPSFISFDGELFRNYSESALSRIVLLSDNYKSYVQWNGIGTIPASDLAILKTAVAKAHKLNKPVRFWNCPDFVNAWAQFKQLGVDFINTDHIAALASFLGGNN